MSEDTSTTGASEADQTTAGAADTGAAADGSAGGTQAAAETGDSFAAERERLQATIRDLQAAKDREAAARAKAEQAGSTSTESVTPTGLTLADLRRVRELDRLSQSLKTEFPEAAPALFDADPLDFESAEAYRLAVAKSHAARAEEKEALRKEVDAEVRARYAKVHGELPEESTPAGGQAVTGMPTLAQIAAMNTAEQMAFEEANPGVIDKLLATASTDGLIGSKMGQ